MGTQQLDGENPHKLSDIPVFTGEEGLNAKIPQLQVISAAIELNGLIFSAPRPARHHHLLNAVFFAGMPKQRVRQGFVLNDGTFCGRERAARIAFDAGQIKKRKTRLFSEDIW